MDAGSEEQEIRAVVLENARSILAARKRVEGELIAAKEALRESEQRLRAIFEQAAVGIAISNLDGTLEQTNRKFVEILGYELGELAGRSAFDLSHPEDVEKTKQNVAALSAGDIPEYSYEKRYLRKDGSVVWTMTTVGLLRNPQGKPSQFIGVIEDITERRHTQQALVDETRVLELLNKTGLAIAAEVSVDAIVQRTTVAATELSGAQFGAFFYKVVGAAGESYQLFALAGAPREAFEKFGMPRNTAVFNPTFQGEGIIRSDDITQDPRYGKMGPHFGMPKGHPPVCSYLAVPVISRFGHVIGGLFFGHPKRGVFNDRTERLVAGVAAQATIAMDNAHLLEERHRLLEREKAARSEAERMSALKDDFLATLSHELRTPLSAILGWTQVVSRRSMTEDELKKAMEVIERNARAQTRLIEDMLDMSRITSGQLRLDVQPVNPIVFIESAIETVRPAADAKGIRLEKLLDPAAGPIAGDPGRLQQVAWNVLSNAIRFTPKDGKVQILLQRVNSHIEISIADTGIGIAADFLPFVFDRFRQADGSTTRRHGGLGLGLAISKSLVELHGGTIGVTSEEGGGSTFTIHLPVTVAHNKAGGQARAHPATTSHEPARIPLPDLSGIVVLAVDDHADARDLISQILEDCGATVITAAGAVKALELLRKSRPHILVSDIGMPEVDGIDLLRMVRALGKENGADLPAIALTAFARSEDRTKVLRAGFRLHVSKPVEAAELCAAVATVVGRSGP